MRVPLSWLGDYVPLPPDPAALIERLTQAGLEATGVQVFGQPVPEGLHVKPSEAGLVWERDRVVVGRVLQIAKHPDADKLKLVTIDYGAAEPKVVVTGAPNIAPGQSGMKVVLGLRGTRYYSTDKEGRRCVLTLEPKALRGIMNDAMCMSDFELGISEDHDGIIILDEADGAPGTPVQDLLGERVVDLDVLPNMARCLALIGIAREVAALTGTSTTIAEPSLTCSPESITGRVQVELAAGPLCSRYSATVIRHLRVGPSPRWMRSRLQYAGMRPINNIVDITNYVLLEYGQPLHAFDYDVLVKRAPNGVPSLCVRPAHAGEKLLTLDGHERTLTPENLVIADAAGAIALAGVMGGRETEVTASTTTILLESANFDFVSVRRTARRFNLFSEAAARFSKGVHPEVVPVAARRAAQLFQAHAGGEVLAGCVDVYPTPHPDPIIELNASEIPRLLGFTIADAEVERVLAALQFHVTKTASGWRVRTPPTRLDIQVGSADLIEELARVCGYDRLPESLPTQPLSDQRGNPSLEGEERVRDRLVEQGLQECITYSFSGPSSADSVVPGLSAEGCAVTLLNPISPERSTLRRTLVPGLLETASRNLAVTESVALFELGPVFLAEPGRPLPQEPRRLALVLSGRRTPSAWDDAPGAPVPAFDFFDLKGVLEALLADLHIGPACFAPQREVRWLHPMRAASLSVNGAVLGVFGELHPSVARNSALADRSVLVGEFDLDALLAAAPDRVAFSPIPTAPPAKRDIAVIVPADLPADRVRTEMKQAAGELLAAADLFDVYTGPSIPPETKSLAFALVYQAADRTLGEKEIEKVHQKIEGRLRHMLGARIRGKD